MLKKNKCGVCGYFLVYGRYKRKGKVLCRRHYAQMRHHGRITNREYRSKFDLNDVVHCGNYDEIILRDEYAREVSRVKVDSNKVSRVLSHKWSLRKDGYVQARVGNTTILLHQFLLGFPMRRNKFTDHISGDKSDNRLSNLREVSPKENTWNNDAVGVYRTKSGNWRALICKDRKRIHIGTFSSFELARKKRMQKQKLLFNQYSRTTEIPPPDPMNWGLPELL